MQDLQKYVDEEGLFGRHGFRALDWTGRSLVGDASFTGADTMEIGAGDGLLSLWLLHAGARSVTSLEPEADGATGGVIAAAQRHRAKLGVSEDRWRFFPETVQRFDGEKGRYKLILSRSTVNHLDEDACMRLREDTAARDRYRAIFGKLREMLAPGGDLVVADCARVNYWDRLLNRPSPFAPEIEWHKHQEPETWAALLEEVGLKVVERRFWHPYYRLRTLGPLLSIKPAARMLASYFVVRVRRPA